MATRKLDIPNRLLHTEAGVFQVKFEEGRVYRESIVVEGGWHPAPQWAQDYYTQVREEIKYDSCKKCGDDIRMMAMMKDGFCSENCRDEYEQAERSQAALG